MAVKGGAKHSYQPQKYDTGGSMQFDVCLFLWQYVSMSVHFWKLMNNLKFNIILCSPRSKF